MVRKILGVVGGYVFIFAFVVGTFSALYAVLGAEGAHKPGTFEVTMTWIVPTFVLSFIAALGGGFLCYLISRSRGAVTVFAAIVLALGLILAIIQASTDSIIEPREGPVSNAEAMQKSIQPIWVAIVNPVIGAMGILIGGRLKKED